MLVAVGVRRENIWVSDIAGVVYEGRTELMDDNKARYARRRPICVQWISCSMVRMCSRAVGSEGAQARVAGKDGHGKSPLIMALANPEPEIMPDLAKAARPDAIIATGRSDYPNQVNNVLCFPFIFRGCA